MAVEALGQFACSGNSNNCWAACRRCAGLCVWMSWLFSQTAVAARKFKAGDCCRSTRRQRIKGGTGRVVVSTGGEWGGVRCALVCEGPLYARAAANHVTQH